MTQTSLHMKTYFSTTVEAAVDLARRELGSEALLVNSRATPEELRHLGRYEVVFATETPATETPIRVPVPRERGPIAQVSEPSNTSTLRRMMASHGVNPDLSRDLVYAILRENSSASPAELRRALHSEMESRVVLDSGLQNGASGGIVALIGPSGRGKTTTLAKLAISEGVARQKQVRIIAVDDNKAGSADRLRSFAATLGVPFRRCSVEELDSELATAQAKQSGKPVLTLIDTPGYGPRQVTQGKALAGYFISHPQISLQLVLRAETQSADVLRTVRRYSDFGPASLIFTGMDEVETTGQVFSSIALSERPVSFFAFGREIPEDIAAATRERILSPIFQGLEERLAAA